jgi:hypothetical protein
MARLKIVLCLLLVLAFAGNGDTKVKVKRNLGFFEPFIGHKLSMISNCDDSDGVVKLGYCPTGIEMTGLSGNKDVHLRLKDDFTAMASGINQFGVSDHDATFVTNGQEIAFQFKNKSGGMCAGVLRVKGSAYCRYTVVKSKCLLTMGIGDRVCSPCCGTCPDYGPNFVKVYTSGTAGGVITCDVTLKPSGANCTTCPTGTGRIISPVAN